MKGRRQDRAIARRQPPVFVLEGDFGDDQAVTETIGRIPAWDGTPFGGVSATGAGPSALPALPPVPPRRPVDGAIFVIIPAARAVGLMCGMDLWRRHADPEAANYEHMFDALRVSALRAGWLPDLYGRWCCPVCVSDPAWATPKPLAHYHPGVPHAPRGDLPSRDYWLQRDATAYHADAAAAFVAGDPATEFWMRIEAEVEVLRRTAEGIRHGSHEAGAR